MAAMNRTWVFAALFVLTLCAAGIAFRMHTTAPQVDPLLQRTFSIAGATHAYAQDVETRAVIGAQTLRITGTYLVDDGNAAYAAFSTTTATIPGQKAVTFSLADISMGSDVYVRLEAPPGTHLSVPTGNSWLHFTSENIPAAYENIATVGPVLDTMKILNSDGAYLTLEKTFGRETGGIHYRFTLSPEGTQLHSGSLGTLVSRLGHTGTVDLWISASGTPRMIVFTGPGYVSTSSLSELDANLNIAAPTTGS
ncbi:MAG TPA: hypothetical protein VMU25_04470 [Candidatus Paceibacterota bacterium]|nr:hypothetical protein [Candidatus Paceibacterota bacterium]